MLRGNSYELKGMEQLEVTLMFLFLMKDRGSKRKSTFGREDVYFEIS